MPRISVHFDILRKFKRFIWLDFFARLLLLLGFAALLWISMAWIESYVYFPVFFRQSFFAVFSGSAIVYLLYFSFKALYTIRKISDDKGSLVILDRIRNSGLYTSDVFFSYFQLRMLKDSFLAQEAVNQKENSILEAKLIERLRLPLKRFIPMFFYVSTAASILLFLPGMNRLSGSSGRLLHFNRIFTNTQLLRLYILNPDLKVRSGETFQLIVKLEMDFRSDYLVLNYKGQQIRMLPNQQREVYSCTLVPDASDSHFCISYPGYLSDGFSFEFIQHAEITSVAITVTPPKYTLNEEEHFLGARDLNVVRGSRVSIEVAHNGITPLLAEASSDIKLLFETTITRISFTALQSDIVFFYPKLSSFGLDTLKIPIFVNSDLPPALGVSEAHDLDSDDYSYGIQGSDDYGLRSLWIEFMYPGDNIIKKIQLPVEGNPLFFSYELPREMFSEWPYRFVFVLADNCSPVSNITRSQEFDNPYVRLFDLAPSIIQSDSMFSSLGEKSEAFKKQLELIRESAPGSQNADWAKKDDISRARESYEKMLQEVSKILQGGLKMLNEDLTKAPTEPEREVLRDLLEDLSKLNNETPQELKTTKDLLEFLKSMELKNEQTKSDLKMAESLLQKELLKQLKEALFNKTDDLKQRNDSLLGSKEGIGSLKLEDLKKLTEELQKGITALQKTGKLDSLSKKAEELSKEVKDNFSESKGKKTGEQQKNLQKNSENLEKMKEMFGKSEDEKEQTSISEENLKKFIYDLTDLSKTSTELVNPFNTSGPNSALDKYRTLKDVSQGFNKLSDSIDAMFKDEAMVLFYVQRKSRVIMDVLQQLTTIANPRITIQSAVYSMNELSLILMDILDQLQQDDNSCSMSGGSCKKKKKPKSGSEGKKMSEEQGKLSEKMKEAKSGQQSMGNKAVFELMNQQYAIRQALQAMLQALQNEGGSKPLNKMGDDLAKEMSELEKNILSRKVDQAKLLEQSHRIETRLLDFEKAVRQKEELSDQRLSKEGKNQKSGNKNEKNLYKDKNKFKFDAEQLQRQSIRLQPFYSTKVIVN